MTTGGLQLSDDLQNDVEISNSPFNNAFNFNARTDDSVGSTESAFSTPHTGNTLGDHSVPKSRQYEESLRLSRDHHMPQSHFESLDDSYVWRDMEGISNNCGIPYDAPNYFDNISNFGVDDFPVDNDWPFSARHHNYTIDQALPARSLFDNSLTELQDVACGVENSTLMTICPHIAPNNLHTIDPPNMLLQGINSQDPQDLNDSLGFVEQDLLSVRPDQLGPIADFDGYTLCPDTTPPIQGIVWPPNPVATSSYENGPSSALYLLPTSQSSSAFADMNENRSGSTTAVTYSTCQNSRSTLPAFARPYARTLQASNGLAQPQQIYGPQEAQLRRSDRRPLTEQERENSREVRQIGSCLVCALKKQKCDIEKICNSCQRMAMNPKLVAENICLRRGILVFRQGILDFFETDGRLGSLPRKLQGPLRKIMIGERCNTNDAESALFPKRLPLMLQVLDDETCDLNTTTLWSKGSKRARRVGKKSPLGIFRTSRFSTKNYGQVLFAYLKAKPSLPSRHLVNLTIRLVSLSTWLYESHPVIFFDNVNNLSLQLFSINDSRIKKRLSDVARSQLLLVAAKEFEPTEEKILSIVDSSMGTLGSNSRNAVILGLCLRRIALLYRDGLKRYKRFVIDSKIIRKREKPKAMYEAVTTAYSLVYSGAKSPYHSDWRVEDHLGAFGDSRELSQLFLEVMHYDKEFCEKNINDEDDIHVTKLFVQRKKGGGPRRS